MENLHSNATKPPINSAGSHRQYRNRTVFKYQYVIKCQKIKKNSNVQKCDCVVTSECDAVISCVKVKVNEL